MKRKLLLVILTFIVLFSITGCKNKQNVEYNEEGKMILKLQRFNSSLEKTREDEEYENSMVMKNETLNITGLKFENIEKGMLSEY